MTEYDKEWTHLQSAAAKNENNSLGQLPAMLQQTEWCWQVPGIVQDWSWTSLCPGSVHCPSGYPQTHTASWSPRWSLWGLQGSGHKQIKKKKGDRWKIHSSVRWIGNIYTAEGARNIKALNMFCCPAIQHLWRRIYSSQLASAGYNWKSFPSSCQLMQELMQRPQLFREGEGHMWSLLMVLIS